MLRIVVPILWEIGGNEAQSGARTMVRIVENVAQSDAVLRPFFGRISR